MNHCFCTFLINFFPSTAPSAVATSVRVSAVTSSSITVQWGPVDCIHRNGVITGYSVRYGEVESAEGALTVEMVSGDFSGGMYTISGLSAATVYTVEVAAKTSAGTGPYTYPINIDTPDSEYIIITLLHMAITGIVQPLRCVSQSERQSHS